MPFLKVRSLTFYYELQGQGPRLLVLPGTESDLRQAATFFKSPIARHFEVLIFDQRGMGQSDKPDIPYTMKDYALDAKAILDALGWTSCALLGISFGGMVAQELALLSPETFSCLVLACTSCGGQGGSSFPLHEWLTLPLETRAERMLQHFDTRITPSWQEAHPKLYARRLKRLIQRLHVGKEDPAHQQGLQRQLHARAQHNTFDRIGTLQMPTLLCGGRFDGFCPPENLHALQQQLPHASLAFFEGGHLFLMEDPNAHTHIQTFLHTHTTSL